MSVSPLPARPAVEDSQIADALSKAEQVCAARGRRLTPMRRAVYRAMLEYGAPVSAYELLDQLQRQLDRRLAPPTVYRALDFLLAEGFVHRIESRSAYVPCEHPGDHHESVYFVCDRCGASQEGSGSDVRRQLTAQARRLGFVAERQVVEVHGVCAPCAVGAASGQG